MRGTDGKYMINSTQNKKKNIEKKKKKKPPATYLSLWPREKCIYGYGDHIHQTIKQYDMTRFFSAIFTK
jgi:hypothetical protein